MVRLEKGKGEGYVKALLTFLIIDVVDFINVGKTMSNAQVMNTVELILEDYWHYKPDHFVLVFNKAKKGYFGKQYDRIDGQVIFSWLQQFDLEFTQEVEQQRHNENKRFEKGIEPKNGNKILLDDQHTKPVPMPEYFKETLSKIGKPKIEQSKSSEPDEQKKIVNELINDFNKLHEQQGDEPGKKFVEVEGKMMDVNEYIEHRIKLDF